ncbi:hypothetical protein DMC14_002835 [Metamycoplasma phocicerebrale]|uniref:Uncharacterized protein n=1 Tax=Metamycoplasma phocicerebrale TaxID=142649 RepID=A0A3Q9VAH2_9BACT|nr:hypothetical protein [Metamycoplasma phocicerebrale]AZZ65702.1 hypothetical protein DMC14_002835 [Metamycoplasma phocicerebrale]
MTKKQKNKIISISIATLLPVTILPIAISMAYVLNKPKNVGFYYKDQFFESQADFEQKIKEDIFIRKEESLDKKIYYLKTLNKQFNDKSDLTKFLYSKIKSHNVIVSSEHNKFDDNSIFPLTSKELAYMQFVDNGNSKSDENITVYQGKGDAAYATEEEAKLSYINKAQIYKFGGKYYSNKDRITNDIILDLNTLNKFTNENEKIDYLLNKYNIKLDYRKNIVDNNDDYPRYKAPNGIVSNAKLNVNNSFNNEATKEFIKNNHKKYIKFKDDSGQWQITTFDEFIKYSLTNRSFINSSAIKITSNQNNRKYLVDVGKQEDCNFYGDYILETQDSSIENIINRENWSEKGQNLNLVKFEHSQLKSIINKFVSQILLASNHHELEKEYINKKTNDEQHDKKLLKELQDIYLKNLSVFKLLKFKEKSEILKIALKEVLINSNETLWQRFEKIIDLNNNGKRGTFFNQLNIIYFSGLAFMAEAKAPNSTIKLFKEYFKLVFNDLNSSLEDILGELYLDKNGHKINLWEGLKLNDHNLDINVNDNYFISYLSDSNAVVNAIATINSAFVNATSSGGLLEFSDKVFLKPNSINLDKYKKLYDHYSLKNKDTLFYFDFDGQLKKNLELENSKKAKDVKKGDRIYQNIVINATKGALQTFKDKGLDILENALVNSSVSNLKEDKDALFGYYKQSLINYYSINEKEITSLGISISEIENTSFNKNGIKKFKNLSSNSKFKNYFNNKFNFKAVAAHKYGIQDLLRDKKINEIKSRVSNVVKSVGGLSEMGMGIMQMVVACSNSDINKVANIVEATQKIVGGILGAIGAAFPMVAVVSSAIDMLFSIALQFIGKKNKSDYIYTDTGIEGKHYIWDGGITTTRFWGFSQTKDKTIYDANILSPVECFPSLNRNYYYYDGKEYASNMLSKLNHDIVVNSIISNDEDFMKSNNFKIVYSFEDTPDESEDNYFDSEQQLEHQMIFNKKLQNYVLPVRHINIFNKSLIITKATQLIEALKEGIIKNLNPSLLIQVPKKKSEITNHSIKDSQPDDELKNLISEINRINDNNDLLENTNFIIFDTNLENNKGNKIFYNSLEFNNKVNKIFMSRITVNFKLASREEFLINKKYSDLKVLEQRKIFSIIDNKKRLFYFSNLKNAIEYLVKDEFLAIEERKYKGPKKTLIIYDNQEFDSISKVYEYCKKFIKSIEEYEKSLETKDKGEK